MDNDEATCCHTGTARGFNQTKMHMLYYLGLGATHMHVEYHVPIHYVNSSQHHHIGGVTVGGLFYTNWQRPSDQPMAAHEWSDFSLLGISSCLGLVENISVKIGPYVNLSSYQPQATTSSTDVCVYAEKWRGGHGCHLQSAWPQDQASHWHLN